MTRSSYPNDLNDAEWDVLQQFFPEPQFRLRLLVDRNVNVGP